MSAQFGGVVRAIIGRQGAQGRQIEGLRIAFDVIKTDAPSTPNTATIKFYNVGRATQAALREADSLVQLFAGYGDRVPLIFLGAITRVQVESDGTDIVATVHSGKSTTGTAPVNQAFSGQQTLKDMIGVAAAPLQALGIDTEAITDRPVQAPRGVRLSGEPGAVLNRLTRANDLDWFIDDGVVKVVPRGQSTQERAYTLSPSTGLIGSPRTVKPAFDTGGNRLSVEARCMLNPELRLRRIIQIAGTRDLEGWYQIRRIQHEGDLWGQTFSTLVECTPVEAR